ncbi:hypothetical protein ACTL4O_001065 [Salmonella enterica]
MGCARQLSPALEVPVNGQYNIVKNQTGVNKICHPEIIFSILTATNLTLIQSFQDIWQPATGGIFCIIWWWWESLVVITDAEKAVADSTKSNGKNIRFFIISPVNTQIILAIYILHKHCSHFIFMQ